MPFTRPRLSRPLPWAPKPRVPWRRPRLLTGGAGLPLSYRLSTWGFDAQVYIAFDGPTAANPAWLDVTEFVEIETSTISIARGRGDGLSDVNVGTCSLTVDNTDGRWTATNPSGVWFGLIRKGIWLRVDLLPPSGTVSRRFTGFITSLPTGWAGLYATTVITASDRFVLLGQAPVLPAMTSAEVLFDTSTGPVVAAHYPLSESSGTTSFGDISGNLSKPLMPTGWGTSTTALLKAGAVPAPGFDGQQTVQFTPTALATGTVLTTTVAPWNSYNGTASQNYGVLEVWLQTTTTGVSQAFASLWDPGGACALTYTVDGPTGYLALGIEATSPTSAFGNVAIGTMVPGVLVSGATVQTGVVLNDGLWHYISIAAVVSQVGASASFVINIDGKTIWIGGLGASISTALNTLVIGGGFAGTSLQNFTGNLAGASWILTSARASNYPAHYAAGQSGFYGESVDQRIARIARYAGIPQPTTLQIPAPGYNPVPVYSGSYGPWTNLSACVHQVGTQSIIGRQPLDVMREDARTENMPLYIDRSGYLAIQPCTLRYNTPVAWSVDARDLEETTAFTDDFTYTVNQMAVTPNGQASQTVIGAAGLASQAKYGVYAQSLASASLHTTEAANLGLAAIAAGADPAPRLAPLDMIANTLARQTGIITPNPNFTGTILPWAGLGGATVALSSAVTYQGAPTSGLLTPNGINGFCYFESGPSGTVAAGHSYTVAGLFYSPVGYAVSVGINWYGAAGYISTSLATAVAIPANTWTTLSMTGVTAPAGALYATALGQESSTPPAGALLYAYALAVTDPAAAYGNAWYDAVLASDISSVISVANLPAQAPASSLSVFEEGYTETIGAGQHTFSFACSPQTFAASYTCDSPTLGLCDTPGISLPY